MRHTDTAAERSTDLRAAVRRAGSSCINVEASFPAAIRGTLQEHRPVGSITRGRCCPIARRAGLADPASSAGNVRAGEGRETPRRPVQAAVSSVTGSGGALA